MNKHTNGKAKNYIPIGIMPGVGTSVMDGRMGGRDNVKLLIVPRRYFFVGSSCFKSWYLKLFVLLAPYVCFHILAKFTCR